MATRGDSRRVLSRLNENDSNSAFASRREANPLLSSDDEPADEPIQIPPVGLAPIRNYFFDFFLH